MRGEAGRQMCVPALSRKALQYRDDKALGTWGIEKVDIKDWAINSKVEKDDKFLQQSQRGRIR